MTGFLEKQVAELKGSLHEKEITLLKERQQKDARIKEQAEKIVQLEEAMKKTERTASMEVARLTSQIESWKGTFMPRNSNFDIFSVF